MAKTIYEAPMVSIEVISIEYGFASSPFGEANRAGSTVRETADHSYDL